MGGGTDIFRQKLITTTPSALKTLLYRVQGWRCSHQIFVYIYTWRMPKSRRIPRVRMVLWQSAVPCWEPWISQDLIHFFFRRWRTEKKTFFLKKNDAMTNSHSKPTLGRADYKQVHKHSDKASKEKVRSYRMQEEHGPKKFIKPWRTGTKSQQQIPPKGKKKGFRGKTMSTKWLYVSSTKWLYDKRLSKYKIW